MTNSSVGQLVAEISLIIVYINKLITWELKTDSESVLGFLNGPNSEVFPMINELVKINYKKSNQRCRDGHWVGWMGVFALFTEVDHWIETLIMYVDVIN